MMHVECPGWKISWDDWWLGGVLRFWCSRIFMELERFFSRNSRGVPKIWIMDDVLCVGIQQIQRL